MGDGGEYAVLPIEKIEIDGKNGLWTGERNLLKINSPCVKKRIYFKTVLRLQNTGSNNLRSAKKCKFLPNMHNLIAILMCSLHNSLTETALLLTELLSHAYSPKSISSYFRQVSSNG